MTTRSALAARRADVVRLAREGFTDAQIAAQLGVNLKTVGNDRRTAGEKRRQGPKALTDAQKQQIRGLVAEGLTSARVAVIVGCSPSAVRRLAHTTKCEVDDCDSFVRVDGMCRKHYEKRRREKAVADRTNQIRELARQGHTNGEICRLLAVSDRTVANTLKDTDIDRDNLTCPHGCGRPRHLQPAIACPAINLTACPGIGDNTEKETAA